jgi:hypothetical protein
LVASWLVAIAVVTKFGDLERNIAALVLQAARQMLRTSSASAHTERDFLRQSSRWSNHSEQLGIFVTKAVFSSARHLSTQKSIEQKHPVIKGRVLSHETPVSTAQR